MDNDLDSIIGILNDADIKKFPLLPRHNSASRKGNSIVRADSASTKYEKENSEFKTKNDSKINRFSKLANDSIRPITHESTEKDNEESKCEPNSTAHCICFNNCSFRSTS